MRILKTAVYKAEVMLSREFDLYDIKPYENILLAAVAREN